MPAPKTRLKQMGIGGILGGFEPPKEPVEEAARFAQSLLKPSRPSLPTPNPRVPDVSRLPDALTNALRPPPGGRADIQAQKYLREARSFGTDIMTAGSKAKEILKGFPRLIDVLEGRR